MGKLQTLAAGTALLALGVQAQFSYMGCAALDTSTIVNTTELYPQGPQPCLAYCNSIGIGYSYAGLTAQFCSCWVSSPVVIKSYADSEHMDCSFNCDAPYNAQYCGGIDITDLNFLYSFYAGVAPPVVGTPPTSSTTGGLSPASSEIVGLPATTSSGEQAPSPQSSSAAGGMLPTSPGTPGDGGLEPSMSSLPLGGNVPTTVGGSVPPSSTTLGTSPSSTPIGTSPVVDVEILRPGQTFVISIASFLKNVGDQAISWVPSPPWLLYNVTITSFYGTVPADQPVGPLFIVVTAGPQTTGANGLDRRQLPSAVYSFTIELLIELPVASATPTPVIPNLPGGPGPVIPGASYNPTALPSYTNTIYKTVTSTITRCPVCAPEQTIYLVPIGTTCITAEVYTTPCEITVTMQRSGVATPTVITTTSVIPYNPAESTVVVTTVMDQTTKYTRTVLIAVTKTVLKVKQTGDVGPVQAPPPPPPPAGVPYASVSPPNVAIGTGTLRNFSQNAAPTFPVTAGARRDRFVEVFVLLSAVAFGALLLL